MVNRAGRGPNRNRVTSGRRGASAPSVAGSPGAKCVG